MKKKELFKALFNNGFFIGIFIIILGIFGVIFTLIKS